MKTSLVSVNLVLQKSLVSKLFRCRCIYCKIACTHNIKHRTPARSPAPASSSSRRRCMNRSLPTTFPNKLAWCKISSPTSCATIAMSHSLKTKSFLRSSDSPSRDYRLQARSPRRGRGHYASRHRQPKRKESWKKARRRIRPSPSPHCVFKCQFLSRWRTAWTQRRTKSKTTA